MDEQDQTCIPCPTCKKYLVPVNPFTICQRCRSGEGIIFIHPDDTEEQIKEKIYFQKCMDEAWWNDDCLDWPNYD